MPMLGHCLVAVHASSALNAQLASTLSLGSHAARNRPNASAGPVFPRTGRSHPLCGPPIPGSSEDQESLITRSVCAASASHAAWETRRCTRHARHAQREYPTQRGTLTGFQWLLRDDLARVEVPAGIHGGEQPIDHVHAGSRNVLFQPCGMLSADCVMMRERAA